MNTNPRRQSSDPAPWTLVLILFGLSFLIRILLVSKGPFNIDCLVLARQAQQTLQDHKLYYLTGTGYPLTVLLGACFIVLGKMINIHDPVLAVNLMSVCFSSLTIIPFYFFVSRMINSRAAVFATLMLSILPVFLSISVYGKSFTAAYFFLFCALFWLARFLCEPSRRFLVFSGAAWGAMAATRLQDTAIVLIPATVLLTYHVVYSSPNIRRQLFSSLLSFLSPVFLLTAFFHAPFLLSDLRTDYLAQLKWYLDVNANPSDLKTFFFGLQYPLKIVLFVMSPVGLLAALLGLLRIHQEKKRVSVFLSLWAITALLLLGGRMNMTARYLMPLLFPLLIAQGAFFAYLTGFRNRPFQAAAILSFCLILGLLTKEILPPLKFRHHYALLPDAARHFSAVIEPEAVIITGDEGLFLIHYGKRALLGRPRTLRPVPHPVLEEFQRTLEQELAAGVPAYITSSGLYSYDPEQQFSRFLKEHYVLEYRTQHLSDDWHHSGLELRLGPERLFRVLPRIASEPDK